MKIRYLFYLAIAVLCFIAAGTSDLKLGLITTLTAVGLTAVTEVLSRLADKYAH